MELSGHTVLVTGGASGIGNALALRFVREGSAVVVCGRRADKLREAQSEQPALTTIVCDVSRAENRVDLVETVLRDHPALDVLVNNAGIQRRVDLTKSEAWDDTHEELAINLEAQIHLCMLLIPHLLKQAQPAIINVTSALAMVPRAAVPVYSATKAAFHSFTLSLRSQLADTPLRVIEVAPPAVDTDLGGVGLHTWGVPLDEFADHVMSRLRGPDLEITYQMSERAFHGSRLERDEIFARINPKA